RVLVRHITPSPLSFFFTDPATTEISTLSLHDALPISAAAFALTASEAVATPADDPPIPVPHAVRLTGTPSSEVWETAPAISNFEIGEHTSELQSLAYLVCRLLLEKKKKKNKITYQRQT